MLELGSNRIRVIENLSGLHNLQQIWLGRNKISCIQNLDTLVNLRKLSIQSNRIVTIGRGLQGLVNLEELYLSHNGIESMIGLENLSQLRVLDLGANRIKKIEAIEASTLIEELWLNNNYITDFNDLKVVKDAKGLQTIYLEHNPIQKAADYKEKIVSSIPSLIQLDALQV